MIDVVAEHSFVAAAVEHSFVAAEEHSFAAAVDDGVVEADDSVVQLTTIQLN